MAARLGAKTAMVAKVSECVSGRCRSKLLFYKLKFLLHFGLSLLSVTDCSFKLHLQPTSLSGGIASVGI